MQNAYHGLPLDQQHYNYLNITDTKEINRLIRRGLLDVNHVFEKFRHNGDRKTLLYKAIEVENEELVEVLLQNGANPNTPYNKGDDIEDYPLMLAVRNDADRIVDLIFEYKTPQIVPNVNQYIEKRHEYPLLIAIKNGNFMIVQKLIEKKANANFGYAQGAVHPGVTLPLHAVLKEQNPYKTIVEILLKAGAKPNLVDLNTGEYPLMLAIQKSDSELVSLLIAKGADPEMYPQGFKSPLNFAIELDPPNMEILKELARKEVNFTKSLLFALTSCNNPRKKEVLEMCLQFSDLDQFKKEKDPFLYSCLRNYSITAKFLLELKIYPYAEVENTKDDKVNSISVVCRNGFEEILDVMLNHKGFDPRMKRGKIGYGNDMEKQLMGECLTKGHVSLYKKLIAYGFDEDNLEVGDWYHLAYIAIASSKKKMMDVLDLWYGKGFNPNQENFFIGKLPLFIAVEKNAKLSLEYMIRRSGKSFDLDKMNKDGNTAVHLAIQKNRIGILEILLKNGADPNMPTSSGALPLVFAVTKKSIVMTTLLLDNGANPSAQETRFPFSSPLAMAIRKEEEDIAELLCGKGADTNERITNGGALIHVALIVDHVHNYKTNFTEILLRHKADPNVVYLIESEEEDPEDPDKIFYEKTTAMKEAYRLESDRLMKILMKYGGRAPPLEVEGPNKEIEEYLKKLETETEEHVSEPEKREPTKKQKMEIEKLVHKNFSHLKLVIETAYGISKIRYHKNEGKPFCQHSHKKNELIEHLKGSDIKSPCPKCK